MDRGQCLSCRTGRLSRSLKGVVACSNAPACKAGWSAAVDQAKEPGGRVRASDVDALLARLHALPRK